MNSPLILLCVFVASVAAQFPNCTVANTSFCESAVYGLTENNIIFRCPYGVGAAVPGNCNDDLAAIPPKGIKYAYCWESSPTSGDAQCTYNCVAVTAANGTTFYPVGCDRAETTSESLSTNTIFSSAPSSSLSSFSPGSLVTGTSSQPSGASSSASTAPTQSTSNTAIKVATSELWQALAIMGAWFAL